MKRTLLPGLAVALVASALGLASAQAPAAAVDVKTLGPQVGAKVPDFTLPDQNGTPRSLASLMGPEGLMLVFNRSADW